MEQTTFAKKTVVLAALGALSLMAATVRAADETETEPTTSVNIAVEIGGTGATSIGSNVETSVTWDDEWLKDVLEENQSFGGLTVSKNTDGSNTITVTRDGSLTIDLPTKEATEAGNDEKVVTFDDVDLNVKGGGAFSNSSHVTFQNGSLMVEDGDFTNEEGGVIKFVGSSDSKASFTLSVADADSVKNFTNEGKIVLGSNAQMTVGSGANPFGVETEDTLALNVGNVEIGQGATLMNKDKGYQVDNKDAEGEGEGAEPGEDQTLVHFGTVTVDGGQFINAEDARSEGTALVIESVVDGNNAAEINGTSVWGTLRLSLEVGEGKMLSNFVDIKDNADFRVTGELIIDSFAENGSFTLDGGSDTEVDANVFADGIDISAGSHVAADDLVQKSDGSELSWKDDVKPAVGTLTIKDFVAEYTPADASEGDGETATGDEDTTGSWTYKKFGDVSAVNTELVIKGNRAAEEDLQKSYSPSLHMSSLTLGGTTMNITYDVDVEKIKNAVEDAGEEDEKLTEGWNKDNIFEKLETLLKNDAELKEILENSRDDFEQKLVGNLADVATEVNSSIEESDLSIGTLTLAVKNENVKVELPDSESEGAGNGESTTTQPDDETVTDTKPETVTVTGNETYGFKNLSLTVTDSNLDVGELDLQTGNVELNGTTMMVGNVKTLNGNLTLGSGYLGLNVNKSVAKVLSDENSDETADGSVTPVVNATVEVGSSVTLGANGKLTFGNDNSRADGDYAIAFHETTDIVFDGKNFSSEALFSQDRTDGNKGKVTVGEDGNINVKATNLSWGVYKLFDEDTLQTDDLTGNVTVESSEETVNDIWKNAVKNSEKGVHVDEKDGNMIVVGGKTVEGSGLEDAGLDNLLNSVFGGERGGAADKLFVGHVLSNASSIEEIKDTLTSVAGMGAVAGLTAMTVDFGAYVTDQVEHHASTIPHQQEGWWVQPIAGKLKSDDLAVGGMKSGYSIDTVGIMGGFDKKLRNGDTIGVAASYQSGDADSEGEGLPVATDVTNYGLHLWHARQFDAYRLMGMFSYSKTSGDAKMNYAGNELTSDLGATEISIGARADKEFQWGTVRMIPHVGVRASMIDVDDYTIEMGSEELFKVSEDKLWIFEVPVGVTFASSFEYARWNVQPYVDLTVRGRFGDTDSTFTLEGSNTSDSMKYDVTGDVIGDLRIGYMSTFQDLNLGMSYGLSAGDGGRQNHQIEATLRLDF